MGTEAEFEFDPGRHRPELPEHRRDCLPVAADIGSKQGPTGGKILTKTTFIQRLNTKGGSAPAEGCSIFADVGKQTLVPYTADYYFFRGDQ